MVSALSLLCLAALFPLMLLLHTLAFRHLLAKLIAVALLHRIHFLRKHPEQLEGLSYKQ